MGRITQIVVKGSRVTINTTHWSFKVYRALIHTYRQANTEADVLVQISYMLFTKWLCTHTHLHTHIYCGTSTRNTQKRMW